MSEKQTKQNKAASTSVTSEHIKVSAAGGLTRFCRAGHCFTKEGTILKVSELDKGVLERLVAEPNLHIEAAKPPAPASTEAASAAE